MAVLKIRKYGDPVLRRRAEPVGEVTPEIRSIVADMIDTMYDEVGIGLAAPQVGVALRLVVVGDEEGRGAQALLDPVITAHGGEGRGLDWPRRQAPAAVRGTVGLGDDRDDLVLVEERVQGRERELEIGRAHV